MTGFNPKCECSILHDSHQFNLTGKNLILVSMVEEDEITGLQRFVQIAASTSV